MEKIQEVFNKIEEIKKEKREINKAYKDALLTSGEYQEITDKLKNLKERKKQIEEDIKSDFNSEFTRLEDLKIDLEAEKEMLSDIALNKLLKGEKLEIKDKYDNNYEPIFSVRFKKIG